MKPHCFSVFRLFRFPNPLKEAKKLFHCIIRSRTWLIPEPLYLCSRRGGVPVLSQILYWRDASDSFANRMRGWTNLRLRKNPLKNSHTHRDVSVVPFADVLPLLPVCDCMLLIFIQVAEIVAGLNNTKLFNAWRATTLAGLNKPNSAKNLAFAGPVGWGLVILQ